MWTPLTVLVLVLVIALIIRRWLTERLKFAEAIPRAEPCHWLLGNLPEFFGKSPGQVFAALHQCFRQHDRLFTFRFGPQLAIGVTHPALIQTVLTHPDCQAKPDLYKVVRLPSGLLAARYETWKAHRKALNSTFNLRILHSFMPIFNDCGRRFVGQLERYATGGHRCNILEYISACTLEMISRTSLGGKALERAGNEEFIGNLELALKTIGKRIFNVLLHIDCLYQLTDMYRREMKAINICQTFTNKIIQDKHVEIAALVDENENVGVKLNDDEQTYKKPEIFIDQLMKAPLTNANLRRFTDQEVSDHIYTMIVAGNETSATQLAHTCLLLAMHPAIQDKAYREINEVVISKDEEITVDLLKELRYTENVLKESMRLMPVAPIVGRENLADIVLDGHRIPKGNILLLNFYSLHRRKDVWGPTVDEFVPERFDDEAATGRHPFAHLPFSGGPRGCIGYRYAMLSLKTMLALILKNYELTTDIRYGDIRYEYQISLNLAFPHAVRLRHR